MATKDKRPKLTTPQGIAIFPFISRPDTKFDADGVYKTLLALEGADADGVVEAVATAQAEAKAEAEKKAKAKRKKPKEADLPYEEEIGEDTEETGRTLFKFKSKASGVTREGKPWKRTLPIFDAKGKKLAGKKSVFGGSTIIISYTAMPWVNPKFEYGVKLQMEAVQVIDLVSGSGGASASAYGFGSEEGYEYEDEDEGIPENEEADDASEEDATSEEEDDF